MCRAPFATSLLTGELRAATVKASVTSSQDCYVLEVSRQGIEPVLRRRPNLVTALSDVIAERRVKNLDAYRDGPEEYKLQRRTSMVGRVMASVTNTMFGGGKSDRGKSPDDGKGQTVAAGSRTSTAGARWAQQQGHGASTASTGLMGRGGVRSSTGNISGGDPTRPPALGRTRSALSPPVRTSSR